VRQRNLLFIISAAIVVLQLTAGGVVLFAENGENMTKADRESGLYTPVYDSSGAEGFGDIIPGYVNCAYSSDDGSCRAASVSNGSVEVRYPGGKSGNNKCRTTFYTVKRGDTLYSISRKTGSPVDSITDLNRIKGNRIYSGMKLKIESCGKGLKEGPAENSCKKSSTSKTSSSTGRFSWPMSNISSYKRDGSSDIRSLGIFIKGVPNSDVVASMDGVVKKIGYMRGYGRYVAISHEGRYVTVYSNLSGVYVKEGVRVSRGKVIGKLSSDRTLHFQIGHAGKPENPLKHLPGRGKG